MEDSTILGGNQLGDFFRLPKLETWYMIISGNSNWGDFHFISL